MKSNKEILNEAFFKKPSYSEKVAKSLPQYQPVPKNDKSFGSPLSLTSEPAMLVTDTDEVKKRLAGTFGATFGNNSIRSMASKSIKTFPIIVSDNLSADTCVMLKKLMEDQYAEILNLLISNQVVDLSAYTSNGEEGNIAIQALDSISGSDFKQSRLADKANRTGSVTADDLFANVPLYNLLRENNMVIDTGDSILNTLFENACVVPSEHADMILDYVQENFEYLVEAPTERDSENSSEIDANETNKKDNGKIKLADYLDVAIEKDETAKIVNADKTKDALRGYFGIDAEGKEVYNKLTNANIVVDSKQLTSALNRTVGEFLVNPANKIIRDKFEKATFLLECERISGLEYIDYVTLRLGLPMSKETRKDIVTRFRTQNIRVMAKNAADADAIRKAIRKNEKIGMKHIDEICKITGTDYIKAAGAGVGGAGTGLGIAAIIGVTGAPGFIAAAIMGASVGSGAYLLWKLIKKRKENATFANSSKKIEGWERVEALIDAMEAQQKDIRIKYEDTDEKEDFRNAEQISMHNMIDVYTEYNKSISNRIESNAKMSRPLREAEDLSSTLFINFNENHYTNFLKDLEETLNECENDESYKVEVMAEALTTAIPMKTKYITKKEDKGLLIAPEFSARSNYAYGSTEIERKDNKDRRYNQPLIMTVKFRERFSDGKFSDNELTAVIGILGKIIRVPSEEMKYILKSNAEGETLRGVFMGNGKISNLVSDILDTSKISKDVKELPQSADMWKNLEKVATLAAANKLTGKKNNNIANAHIVFSQKEVDELRSDEGIDYLRDIKLVANLMKRYSAFTVMVANDAGQRVHIFDDLDDISWNVVPYTALMGKDTGDQLAAALAKLGRI